MPKHLYQQRNGRRADPPDDLDSHQMQVFALWVEESSQQRERTHRPLDEDGVGSCADLLVAGLQAICPVTYQVGVSGKTRLGRGQRRLGQRDRLAKASSKNYCESRFRHVPEHIVAPGKES
jgi:hypothetical protein